MPTSSIIYRIALVNPILNFRRYLKVQAHSYSEARLIAIRSIPGYSEIESCIPIAYLP